MVVLFGGWTELLSAVVHARSNVKRERLARVRVERLQQRRLLWRRQHARRRHRCCADCRRGTALIAQPRDPGAPLLL